MDERSEVHQQSCSGVYKGTAVYVIESLIELADRDGLGESGSEWLKTIRPQVKPAALAKARLAALRRALAELPAAQTHRLSRMERAYRDGGAI